MKGKVKRDSVLITGSSKGLGKELSLIFANNGYDTVIHGRNIKDLNAVQRKILEKGVSCIVIRGDIRSSRNLDKLLETAKEENISILINNAAQHCPHLPLEEMNDKQIDELVNTNLLAPIKLTRRIYKYFLSKKHGTIININSVAGLESQRLRSIYCASKWGLRGFTESFRLEANKHNVRVIEVYPSRIKTRESFIHGMEAEDVAKKIFETYENENNDTIIIDDRNHSLKSDKR